MKSISRLAGTLLAASLILLAACASPASPTATADSGPVFTQIAMTALAYQTQTAAAVPSATDTPQASATPEASNTPLVTDTPATPVASFTPVVLSTATGSLQGGTGSCDNAQFVTDVTIPDGTEINAGAPFIKTWRIKNLGPCIWNQDYRLTFGWGGTGTDWNKITPVTLVNTVQPGDTVDVSVSLSAPSVPGNYSAAFRMQNDKFATIGVNSFFGPTMTVVITVK